MRNIPTALFDSFLRLSSILLIWAALFLIFMLGRVAFVGLVGLMIGIPAAFIISHFILNRPFIMPQEKSAAPKDADKSGTQAKPKRDDDLAVMFHLLDEDDRYDIQQRIKQRLMERIDTGEAADFNSFADLLNERPRQKRS